MYIQMYTTIHVQMYTTIHVQMYITIHLQMHVEIQTLKYHNLTKLNWECHERKIIARNM
jgi:hypothetical protein